MLPQNEESVDTAGITNLEAVPNRENCNGIFTGKESEPTGQYEEEVERYLREPSVKEENYLQWWSRNVQNCLTDICTLNKVSRYLDTQK